jgi:hypothetical protein
MATVKSADAAAWAATLELRTMEEIGLRPTPENIDVEKETEKWTRLTSLIDFTGRRQINKGSLQTQEQWWVWDEDSEGFISVPPYQIDDVLYSLGIGSEPRFTREGHRKRDLEREWIKELFRRRHRVSHQRGKLPQAPRVEEIIKRAAVRSSQLDLDLSAQESPDQEMVVFLGDRRAKSTTGPVIR